MIDLKNLCQGACHAATLAGEFIARESAEFNLETVEIKSFNQLVSYVDQQAEALLVKELTAIFPRAGFITEEKTVATEEKEWMWVIDPLDGTTNFIHNLPVFSVSIGLLKDKQPVIGVVYEINRKELFYAWEKGGAWLNGNPIKVKTNSEMEKSLLATGFPYYDFKIMDKYLATLSHLMKHSQGMRRMGSAAVDLAYTACGRFDAFFEYGLSPWDVAGCICLIKEAGGVVSDFSGGDDCIFGRTIIGSSQALYPDFLGVIKTHFNK